MYERKLTGTIAAAGGLAGWLSGPQALQGRALEEGSMVWQVGEGLVLEQGVLRVDTAARVEADNTRPVTSAAVYLELGNVEALLANL